MSNSPYENIQERRLKEQLAALPASSEDWNAKMNAQRKEERKRKLAEIAKLPPVGSRPHCKWCGKELPIESYLSKPGFGYDNNGKFCTLRCGFYWAVKYSPDR